MSVKGTQKLKEVAKDNTDGREENNRKICFCHNVFYKRIVKTIHEGAETIEEIQSETCASTGCGGCEFDVREILAEELEKLADIKKKTGT